MKANLYLFIGYPGAGKTVIAKIINKHTEAFHIWADVERHKFFERPTHSKKESDELYQKLNDATEYLLSQKKSVIYDTNFNFLADRNKMRQIAQKYKAQTVLIWVNTPINIAYKRAVKSQIKRNNYDYLMSDKQFYKIANKLEAPTKSEKPLIIDGSNINEAEVVKLLKL